MASPTIKMTRTSYSRPPLAGFVAVRTSLTVPTGWFGPEIPSAFPTWPMLKGFKAGTMSWDEYRDKYYERLDRKNWAVVEETAAVADKHGTDLAFACWCRSHATCHTHLLLNWLYDSQGWEIVPKRLRLERPVEEPPMLPI